MRQGIFSLFFILCFTINSTLFGQQTIPVIDLVSLKWGLKDSSSNSTILSPTYDYIEDFKNNVAFSRIDTLYGVINQSGQTIIPPQFKHILWLNDTLLRVEDNYHFGVFDRDGHEIIPRIFNEIRRAGDRLIVQKDNLTGLIALNGDILFPIKYQTISIAFNIDELNGFKTAVYKVKINDLEGLVKENGKIIIEPKYDSLLLSSKQTLLAFKGGDKMLMDRTGNELLSLNIYDHVLGFTHELIAVGLNKKYGFVDIHKNTIIPFLYDSITPFQSGVASVKRKGKWGVINTVNEVLIPFKYNHPLKFVNGFAIVTNHDQTGRNQFFINLKGEKLNSINYQQVLPFRNQRALVKSKGFWGVIDTTGEFIIPPVYDEIEQKRAYFVVHKNHLKGLINHAGNTILNTEWNFIYQPHLSHPIMVRKGAWYGYVNNQGEIIIPCEFKNARSFKYGRATVLKEGESYEINEVGERWSND